MIVILKMGVGMGIGGVAFPASTKRGLTEFEPSLSYKVRRPCL